MNADVGRVTPHQVSDDEDLRKSPSSSDFDQLA